MGSKKKKLAKKINTAIIGAIDKKYRKKNGKLIKKTATKLAKKLLKKVKSPKSKASFDQNPVVWNGELEAIENEIAEATEAAEN